jgi:hypothetical protein
MTLPSLDEIVDWLRSGGLPLLQTIGIVASIMFAGLAFRRDARTRKVTTLLDLAKAHRELWSKLLASNELYPILRSDIDPREATEAQRIFVIQVIRHMHCAFEAQRRGLVELEQYERDVASFVTLPIPRDVWNGLRLFENRAFREFVDRATSPDRMRSIGASTSLIPFLTGKKKLK